MVKAIKLEDQGTKIIPKTKNVAVKLESKFKKQSIIKAQFIRQPNTKRNKPFITTSVPEAQVKAESVKNKVKRVKRHRIIIRNLVFDINEKHIRKLLAPFGTIIQVNIPQHPDKKGSRGFAFVQFSTQRQCMKAIKQVNGKMFKGRTVIVDHSVSQKRYLTEKIEEQIQENQHESHGEDTIKGEDNNIVKKEQVDNDQKKELEAEERPERTPREETSQTLSSTVFIRNLPISVTEEQLFYFFKRYGTISFAKIVKDKQTQASRGAGFVKFHSADTAQRLIEYSRSYELFLLKRNTNFKTDPSINLQLEGTILKLFHTETREGIKELIKSRQGEQQKPNQIKKPLNKIKRLDDLVKFDSKNKRRLNLAEYGFWKATQTMNEVDFEKFKRHQKQKIVKLKNTNNSISDTRIILKLLDKNITEDQIKELCISYLASIGKQKHSLIYCKLMLTEDRTKSAGFAFLEFKSGEIAMGFLTQLCKNPQLLMRSPYIIEFAIQDSRKIRKLHKRIHKTGKLIPKKQPRIKSK